MNICKIESSQINTFIKNCFDKNVRIRSLIIYQNGEIIADISVPPYQSTDIQQVYSISKSFTSTAIGLLYDRKILDLDERIVDIFPKKVPMNVSNNLKDMTITHLLSMNTGHDTDTTAKILASNDPVQAFLEYPVKHKPGTHFVYNSGASYMLSAIVFEKTKQRLYDFLNDNLFKILNIEKTYWGKDILGNEFGGFDFHTSNQHVNLLGQLYLNQGFYCGKQILSKKWVSLVSKNWSDTTIYDYSFDWKKGYGFHFWINGKTGYRADGAYGQICLIEPDYNIVFSMLSESNNMQDQLTLMQNLIDDIKIVSQHHNIMLNYYIPLRNKETLIQHNHIICDLEQNKWGFNRIKISYDSQKLLLNFIHRDQTMVIQAGDGTWIFNHILGPRLIRKLFMSEVFPIEQQSFYASFETSNNLIKIQMRFTNLPHTLNIFIRFDEYQVDLEISSSFQFYGHDKTHIRGKIYE